MKKIFLLSTLAAALAIGSSPIPAVSQDDQNQQQDQQQARDDQDEAEQREAQEEQTQARERQQRQQEEARQQRERQDRQRQEQRDQQRERAAEQDRRQEPVELGVRLEDYGDRLAVAQVREQSLAAQAGLQPEDIIVSINDRQVRSPDQLRSALAGLADQRGRVPLEILRNGERQTLYLDLAQRPRAERRFRGERGFDEGGRQDPWLGIALDARYEDFAVVRRVYSGTAADEAGIQQGDWIVGINGQRVQSPAQLAEMIARMEPGQEVDVQVARRVTRTLQARLNEEPRRLAQELRERRQEDRFERQRPGEEQRFRNQRQRATDQEDFIEEEDQFFEDTEEGIQEGRPAPPEQDER